MHVPCIVFIECNATTTTTNAPLAETPSIPPPQKAKKNQPKPVLVERSAFNAAKTPSFKTVTSNPCSPMSSYISSTTCWDYLSTTGTLKSLCASSTNSEWLPLPARSTVSTPVSASHPSRYTTYVHCRRMQWRI